MSERVKAQFNSLPDEMFDHVRHSFKDILTISWIALNLLHSMF
jgi:hypothetical protein